MINQISAWLTLTTKSLGEKLDAIGLLKLAFEKLRFDEKDRIIELLQQRKTRWQSRLSHDASCFTQMSALAQRDYHNTGLGALNWLSDLVDKIEQNDTAYDH
jgi:Zn-dependent M16 (insulinase) family peptidase